MRRGLLGVIAGFALLLSGLLALLSLPDGASAGTAAVASSGGTTAAASHFTFTPTIGPSVTGTTGDNQGFSVESADFAHGYLTKALLANWLRTLGPHGLIRVGGYSVDLIWPAFGSGQNTPAPAQAIGGTVDQADLDNLKDLLDATGWKATIAVPLASVINTSASSLTVSFDQAVAYAVAAEKTLGKDLEAIEVGNEYNIVTSLTPAQYYAWMVQYYDAINAADGGVHVRVIGPSATNVTGPEVSGVVSAVASNTSVSPRAMIANITAHYYESGRCGLDVPGLLSADTYLSRQSALESYVSTVAGLHDGMPAVVNETNSESGSGCPGVSNTYASSLWSLDYLLQAAQLGVQSLNFHTSTAAVCGNYQTSPAGYTTSYRWYAAFCAPSQAALDANQLAAAPLYYGIWAFRQVPAGRFVDLGTMTDDGLSDMRAYGVESPDGTLTVVLINVQDPSAATSSADAVTLRLPASYQGSGRAQVLASSDPAGLSSTDASAISLGGRTISAAGVPSGPPRTTPVGVRRGTATIDVAPGTAQIISFPNVPLPGAVDVTSLSAGTTLLGGQPNPVTVTAANTTSRARAVTATVQVPAGWRAGSVTQVIPAHGQASVTVPVTPPVAPSAATLDAVASSPGVLRGGSTVTGVSTISAPPAGDTLLALDAGCTTSPVFGGYQALTPASVYTSGSAFGWVGAVPQCRDRGEPDPLRRDLVANTGPDTLALAVPAGQHDVYVLVGDPSYAADPITITSGGGVVAQTTTPLPAGQAEWLEFPVSGGSAGQTVELTFSNAPGDYWVVDGLVMLP